MEDTGFRKQEKKIIKPKPGAYVLMGMIALGLGYLVTKDVQLPKMVLVVGALVAGSILFFKGMQKPEIITYVLVAYMPFSKVLVGDFGGLAAAFNVTNALVLFIMVTWFSGKYAQGEPLWVNSPLNLPILLFIFLALISLFRGSYYETGYFWSALTEFKRWVTPIFLFFLVLNTVKERWMIKNVVITIIIVSTLVGLMAIYDYINLGECGDLDRCRVGGISDHSNTLAAFFAYYSFLPFGFFLMNKKKPMYWLLMLPVLIQFRGIMVTFSRGGYLAFALGLYAIAFFRSKIMLGVVVLATVLAVLNPIILPAGIRYRMEQTLSKKSAPSAQSVEELEGNLEASSSIRLKIWTAGMEMVKDHPVFGVGYGLFDLMLPQYLPGVVMDAHNTYLILAAEMGIPTLLIFLLIIFVAGWQSMLLYYQTKDPFSKAFALGVIGGIAALTMCNMFGSRMDSQEVSSYFWILCALIMRLRIIDRKEKNQPVPTATKETLVPQAPLPWFERKGSF